MTHSSRWTCILMIASTAMMLMGLSACKKPEPSASPEGTVKGFYTTRIASGAQGTPSVEELERLAPYLSTELHELLGQALLNHHKLGSRTVQQRRAFSEGDLFSSLFDGPTSFIAGANESSAADEHLISVQLTSAKQLPALSWTDKVKVIRENGHYVIADIQYANHWAFGSNTTLVSSLQTAMGKRLKKNV